LPTLVVVVVVQPGMAPIPRLNEVEAMVAQESFLSVILWRQAFLLRCRRLPEMLK
jgi:hypothetical protein